MTPRIWRMVLPWLLLLAVGAAATALRYGLIESSTIGQQCAALRSPWWCAWRQGLVLGFLHNIYGIAALIAAAMALLSRQRWLAWLAAALGVFALQLYCVESGALAVLVGCLRLLRAQANARITPVEQHRQGQQQIQSQP